MKAMIVTCMLSSGKTQSEGVNHAEESNGPGATRSNVDSYGDDSGAADTGRSDYRSRSR